MRLWLTMRQIPLRPAALVAYAALTAAAGDTPVDLPSLGSDAARPLVLVAPPGCLGLAFSLSSRLPAAEASGSRLSPRYDQADPGHRHSHGGRGVRRRRAPRHPDREHRRPQHRVPGRADAVRPPDSGSSGGRRHPRRMQQPRSSATRADRNGHRVAPLAESLGRRDHRTGGRHHGDHDRFGRGGEQGHSPERLRHPGDRSRRRRGVGALVGSGHVRCTRHDHDLYVVLVDDPSRVCGTQRLAVDAVRGQNLQISGDASEEMSG